MWKEQVTKVLEIAVAAVFVLEAGADVCAVLALAQLLALETAPLALAIGYYMPVVGLMVALAAFIANFPAFIAKIKTEPNAFGRWLLGFAFGRCLVRFGFGFYFLAAVSGFLAVLCVVVLAPLKLSGLVTEDLSWLGNVAE